MTYGELYDRFKNVTDDDLTALLSKARSDLVDHQEWVNKLICETVRRAVVSREDYKPVAKV